MPTSEETLARLTAIPNLNILRDEPLARYTRFGLGGPADLLVGTRDAQCFVGALQTVRELGAAHTVIGDGSNLVVADSGYRGVVLKFSGDRMQIAGSTIHVEAGAPLQLLVDTANDAGLRGLETMTGIPGFVGAAVYGNAGAYGHSISERVLSVHFYDGAGFQTFDNADCGFLYRESVFKRNKEWVILSLELAMTAADPAELKKTSAGILKVRNEKYPPTMKCAGSIFKNCLFAELPGDVAAALPGNVVREGKVPSAYFLEQAGAKGLSRGDIHVAEYHANLIFNGGAGTARDLRILIADLKRRVFEKFGITLEEEVQYVGFDSDVGSV